MHSVQTEEKLLAAVSHFSLFFLPIIIPLAIHILKSDSEFVNRHAKEALIFHVFNIVAFIISLVSIVILIGFLFMIALGLFTLVVVIIASIRSMEGKSYSYPLTSLIARKI